MRWLLKTYGLAVGISLLVGLLVGFKLGGAALLTTTILAVLEISLSFDNAVVNAKVLAKMSAAWQWVFLTLGIVIAVVGVRVILPIALVAIVGRLGMGRVIDMALNHPAAYADNLHQIHPEIAAFGGVFLLMLFLDYITDERDTLWLQPLERRLIKLGRLKGITIAVALVALLLATVAAGSGNAAGMLVAGIIGLVIYAGLKAFGDAFGHQQAAAGAGAGLAAFIYLEVLDASFSLDGVLGAFAITSNIVVITAGLGIGALFVRAMTVHLVEADTLAQYRFLEHGAHYAIGVLAVLLLASASLEISEMVTGLTGLIIIAAAIIDSVRLNRRK